MNSKKKEKMDQFSNSDVRIIKRESLYEGFFKMHAIHLKHKLYSGEWSAEIRREVFERGHAVAVLPYDPSLEEFVLIEQFRVCAMQTSNSPWLIEVIAGMIEEGESGAEVCHREAYEEAGIHLSNLTKAISYLSSPGGTTERLHIYIAKVDSKTAHGIHGLDHESEDIKVLRIAEKTALEWVNQGKIDNAAAIIALQWFAINKDEIIKQWG